MTPTRDRIIETSAELFRRQGYSATGVKQIVTAARAPFGSLYHFFPGGKEELAAAAVRASGELYAQLIPAVFDPAPDIVTGVRTLFELAGQHLHETGYEDACPIATVALEVSSTSETMRVACAEVFESWVALGGERFVGAGFDAATARELTIGMLSALEGAFVLARAMRDTEPLRVAGEVAAQRVEQALSERTRQDEHTRRTPEGTDPARSATAVRVRPRLRARWPDREAGRSPGPASP
jgi:AcrR family transcriptional regulator